MNLNVIESEIEGIDVYAADRIVTLLHRDVAQRPTYPKQEDQDMTVEYRDRPRGEGRDYAPTRQDYGKTESGYKSRSKGAEQYGGAGAGAGAGGYGKDKEKEEKERKAGRCVAMYCNQIRLFAKFPSSFFHATIHFLFVSLFYPLVLYSIAQFYLIGRNLLVHWQ